MNTTSRVLRTNLVLTVRYAVIFGCVISLMLAIAATQHGNPPRGHLQTSQISP